MSTGIPQVIHYDNNILIIIMDKIISHVKRTHLAFNTVEIKILYDPDHSVVISENEDEV